MRVLFERGAFTAADTHATAQMLAAMALALPAYVLIKVLHPSFFAREDTKTPMIFAGFGMVANAVLSIALFVALGGVGIALAMTLSGWLNVALLAGSLARRGEFALDARFRRAFLGILAATVVMGVVIWTLATLLDPWFAPFNGIFIQGAALAALVGTGLAVYLASAQIFGVPKYKAYSSF
jgi:putative peptidoglycan lipid II flippase